MCQNFARGCCHTQAHTTEAQLQAHSLQADTENDPGGKMPSSSGNDGMSMLLVHLCRKSYHGSAAASSADKNASAAAFGVALAGLQEDQAQPGVARAQEK